MVTHAEPIIRLIPATSIIVLCEEPTNERIVPPRAAAII
jgi:hypothetical protein